MDMMEAIVLQDGEFQMVMDIAGGMTVRDVFKNASRSCVLGRAGVLTLALHRQVPK